MKMMKDYHKFYLKCDVLYLVDLKSWIISESIFQCTNFRLERNA